MGFSGSSTTHVTISLNTFLLFKILSALYLTGWTLRQDLRIGNLFMKWPQGMEMGSGQSRNKERINPRLYYQISCCRGQLGLDPAGDSELLGGMTLKIVHSALNCSKVAQR